MLAIVSAAGGIGSSGARGDAGPATTASAPRTSDATCDTIRVTTWFFAPDQIRKRAKEWGPGEIDTRFGAAWAGIAPKLDRWLRVSEAHGPAAVRAAYLDTLNGRVPPELGHILSLSE